MWIGGDLNGGVNIDAIGFAPRNDDNSIVPTDIYELFYWDEQWNSLGVKSLMEIVLFIGMFLKSFIMAS